MRQVLVTGGAGFVGSNLIAQLRRSGGYEITVIDNERLGKREHIAEFDVDFVHGDLRDDAAVAEVVRDKETIIHLAADTRVMDSIEDPRFNFENNVVATFGLLRAARQAGVGRIINASTGGAILGEAPSPVHERMVANPLAPYGASKLAVEGYLSAFSGAYGMAAISLRFSNIYGPRSFHKGSVVAHFFKQILAGKDLIVYGDGSQVRDYLFVGDLVEGIEAAMNSELSGVFQLGKGQPTTINELIAAMREAIGGSWPFEVRYEDFREGEIHTTWCDISKAREQIGFAPATPLIDGLRHTWAWFLAREGAAA